MQPRSMVMALSTATLLLLGGGHHTSVAEPIVPPSVPPAAKIQHMPHPVARSNPAGHQPVTASLVKYQVRPGDTLFAIAGRYHTKIESILQHNPKLQPESLAVGQVLQVPTNTIKKQKSREELAEVAAKMVINQTGEPSRYIKMIPCKLTAYSNSYESTGKNPGDSGYGITATGQAAKEGWTIAVDPRVIPLHSVVYIPGVGVRYAEDTGGAVKGAHIDVFVANDDIARRFGVKEPVNVYLLDQGSGESP